MGRLINRLMPLAIALAVVAIISSGCANRSGAVHAVTATDSLPAPDSTSASGAYTGVSDYRIGPLDLLEVKVFQVEDMDREIRVNSSGFISLPLIGSLQAGGKTVQELEYEIAEKLSQTYLQNPQVSVFVKEFTSQRVTVDGAVKKPGIFPITGRTTLLQVVALSEGLDVLADPRAVVVFRTIEGQRMAALFDLVQIRSGETEDPQIYGDDVIVVEQSGARSVIKSFTDTIRGLIWFRPL